MTKTTDAAKILRTMLGDTPELREMIAEEKLNVHVARMIYDARNARGLTQTELAELVGTKQQSIARLEDADYGDAVRERVALDLADQVFPACNLALEHHRHGGLVVEPPEQGGRVVARTELPTLPSEVFTEHLSEHVVALAQVVDRGGVQVRQVVLERADGCDFERAGAGLHGDELRSAE